MSRLKSEAAKIIAENIKSLEGIGTHSPYTMSAKWNAMFDDVKSGKVSVTQADVTSARWDPAMMFAGDSSNESQMMGLSVGPDSVDLGDSTVSREKRWVMSKTGAVLVDDPHVVDYVLCHVKGYRKYDWGYNAAYYIKGRDIIVSGVLLAVPEIIKMMKEEIETLINSEAV